MNEIKTIKHLIPEDKQYEVIDKIINEELNNKKLSDTLTVKFKEKGFAVRLISALFGGDKQWYELPDLAKVAFIEGAKEALEWEILDSNKWFENSVLVAYDNKLNDLKETDSFFIKNMIKIDDYNLLGYAPLETLYDGYNNTIYTYNYDTQRAPEYKEIGTKGKIVKTYSLNNKAVNEISKDIEDGVYEEDLLIYNVLLKNQNSVPQVAMEQKFENIYNVEIVPNYDRNSKNYTVINPLDGWHRTMAGIKAYGNVLKKGKKLENRGFPIKITIRDLKGAQRIVNQIFKRSDTDRQWLATLNNSDYNEFVDLLIKSSQTLKDNVVKTYDEYIAIPSITYSAILSETVEKYATDIPVNSKLQRKMIAEKMATIIDELFEYLLIKYKTMDILMKETRLADVNIFIGYFIVANELRQFEDYEKYLIKVGDKLMTLTKEELEPLKLSWRNFSTKRIVDCFKNIVKEVIEVEK